MTATVQPLSPLSQFLRFAVIGTVGFGVDVLVLWLAHHVGGLDLYSGRVLSFLVAATTTWRLNRSFTFRHSGDARAVRQWFRFLSVNAVGGAVNYAVYAALLMSHELFRDFPAVAVGFGSIAGLAFNFTASRRVVFGIR